MNEAFLSIGSNMGDRYVHLKGAVHALHSHEKVNVLAVSSIYETAPVGLVDQADFLNMVIQVETSLSAFELLKVCQQIESEQGRVREVRWGPRTVDLDILLYNNEKIDLENLVIPHPRMHERGFVLIPLLEIAPFAKAPVTDKMYAEEVVVQEDGVVLWKRLDDVFDF